MISDVPLLVLVGRHLLKQGTACLLELFFCRAALHPDGLISP